MQDLSSEERRTLRTLRTPRHIQDFLDTIPVNFEPEGDTCLSPRRVLREKRAHCVEGAMLAAVALRLLGREPLVFELRSFMDDQDHVMALFSENGFFGAISKTNHGVLRYREPIYKTLRELAMSFFHEYFLDDGRKTLRSYSVPVNLSRFDSRDWMTSEENLFYIPEYIDQVRHFDILTRSQIAKLRKADPIERDMGKLTEWKK